MADPQNWEMTIVVVGVIVSFFGFLGSVLLGVVGYFLKNFHSEYRLDKTKTQLKEEKVDEKMQKLADMFTVKIEGAIEKIADKINNLPKGSENLSQMLFQFEKDALQRDQAMHKRLDEHSQRIQNNYTRVEQVALRVHEVINLQTGPNLRAQVEKRKAENLRSDSMAELENGS